MRVASTVQVEVRLVLEQDTLKSGEERKRERETEARLVVALSGGGCADFTDVRITSCNTAQVNTGQTQRRSGDT